MKFKYKFYFLLCITLQFLSLKIEGQQLFYSDIVYGGVTGVGFSSGGGYGTVEANVLIPPNSTIKQAFLITATDSTPPPITVVLNDINYTFDESSIITNQFISFQNSTISWSNSSIRALDITAYVDPSILNYSMDIPIQPFAISTQSYYKKFYLFIVFENLNYPKVCCNLFFNNQDVAVNTYYNLANISPINDFYPVGLSLLTAQFCSITIDGSYVEVNENEIGIIGGEDANSINNCSGVYANFAHYDNTLFGLDDDIPDSLMNETDALADIKSYVNNADTLVDVAFLYQSPNSAGKFTNPICAVMLSYSSPCDTFSTSITGDTTICTGENIQLLASGGATYTWFCAFDTVSNVDSPIATPSQTATYICTIKNDSGCVKTEQVKITVSPYPNIPNYTIEPTLCSDSSGIVSIEQPIEGYSYQLNDLIIEQESVFSSLTQGEYNLHIINQYGCASDTSLFVSTINPTQAHFTATPTQGEIPLTVQFNNQSTDATHYTWYIADDTLSEISPSYVFNEIGEFTASLRAYDTYPWCSDTSEVLTIITEYPFNIIIPSTYFSYTDSYQIYTSRVSQLDYTLFNSIGQQVYHRHFVPDTGYSPLWELSDVARGVYLYTVKVTGEDGEVREIVGRVLVM